MGYETTLVVCDNYGKKMGYHNIIATVELSKCGSQTHFGGLIKKAHDSLQANPKRKEIDKLIERHSRLIENLREEGQEKWEGEKYGEYSEVYGKLKRVSPFIYHSDHNHEDFSDCYGDNLLRATVDEMIEALERDIAEDILKGEKPYRRFTIALGVLKEAIDGFDKKRLTCILYGH